MKSKFSLLVIAFLGMTCYSFAWYAKLYPSNWWVGMKWNKVQVLVYGDYNGFNKETVKIIDYPGVKLLKVTPLENEHYIVLDIEVAPTTKPGNVEIELINNDKAHSVLWPLEKRRTGLGKTYAQGVNSSDLIYLLMPDRFSNGDSTNDRVEGMRDQSLNRSKIYDRHGGDLQGVINHLDYLKKLGVTTLWMTPVIENDQPNRTEHGYAFTDHYSIEPRIGGAEKYIELSDALHKRGMKLIQDAVYNHVGSKHITFLDQPTKDWYHQWPTYTGTSYKDQTLFDPYASKSDAKRTSDGWFTREMPDLNQSNPYVANYLIQHAIWSVEKFGVDGWRIDTYIYNDLPFMNRCNKALTDEYPAITMFGETWVHGTAAQAYFVENKLDVPFKSNLQGATDFQTLMYGIQPALKQDFGWTEGVNKLYTTLSNDFLYKDANRNCIFLDNHDLTRIFSDVGGDVEKVKVGIAWLLTTRGIPEIYYGTEILMKGEKNPDDGNVRLDFPGGWKGDAKNAFTGEGMTDEEKDMLHYVTTFANFRKNSSAITKGALMQYVPDDGLYVYFRYDAKQTLMCVMNTSNKEKEIDFSNYIERTKGFTGGKNIVTGATVTNKFSVPAKRMWVLELSR
ncbi:MAG: glycoside hydrolase family 13 protein [Chitinophagaceae bacterium]|nr:glycoside hydrolase family 13 protein [Chitinophagaceae bacterium]